jgi:hypothetical protein
MCNNLQHGDNELILSTPVQKPQLVECLRGQSQTLKLLLYCTKARLSGIYVRIHKRVKNEAKLFNLSEETNYSRHLLAVTVPVSNRNHCFRKFIIDTTILML